MHWRVPKRRLFVFGYGGAAVPRHRLRRVRQIAVFRLADPVKLHRSRSILCQSRAELQLPLYHQLLRSGRRPRSDTNQPQPSKTFSEPLSETRRVPRQPRTELPESGMRYVPSPGCSNHKVRIGASSMRSRYGWAECGRSTVLGKRSNRGLHFCGRSSSDDFAVTCVLSSILKLSEFGMDGVHD